MDSGTEKPVKDESQTFLEKYEGRGDRCRKLGKRARQSRGAQLPGSASMDPFRRTGAFGERDALQLEYWPEMRFMNGYRAMTEPERAFEGGVDVVIWALPSSAARSQAKEFAKFFKVRKFCFMRRKGIEAGTLEENFA